ncbi:hypothetical protein [Streptomyces lydicus]|uniref:hypothetical protein n=1 Tax=Streptomyces lydicus TaxID=47763 RepID=UPI0036EED17C
MARTAAMFGEATRFTPLQAYADGTLAYIAYHTGNATEAVAKASSALSYSDIGDVAHRRLQAIKARAHAHLGDLAVFELAVDAGFEAEPVRGDAQVGAGAFGDVGRRVVMEVEVDLAAAGMGGDFEVLPDSGCCCGHGVGSWCSSAPIPGTFRRTQRVGGAVDPP